MRKISDDTIQEIIDYLMCDIKKREYPKTFAISIENHRVFIDGKSINPKIIEYLKKWISVSNILCDEYDDYVIDESDLIFLVGAARKIGQGIFIINPPIYPPCDESNHE